MIDVDTLVADTLPFLEKSPFAESGCLLLGLWENRFLLVTSLATIALLLGSAGRLWWQRHRRRSSPVDLQGVLDALPEAIALFDARGRLAVANRRLAGMLPDSVPPTALLGTTADEIYARLSADDAPVEHLRGMARRSSGVGTTADVEFELRVSTRPAISPPLPRVPTRGPRAVLVRERAHGSGGLLVSLHDTDQEFNRHFHDPLTSLPNRRRLLDELARRYEHGAPQLALIVIDLRHFRQINDTYGRMAGDRLLQQTASCLCRDMPTDALVTRTAGDEFAVLSDCDATGQARGDMERHVLKFLDRLESGLDIGPTRVPVRASVGIAHAPDHGRDAISLVGAANSACAHAKRLGHDTPMAYNSRHQKEAKRRHRLEIGLRQAIERDEFSLQYQPQIDIRTGVTCGTEALLRWQHPELGRIAPMDFIPIAEQSNLINRLGSWVLGRAIDDYQRLGRFGLSSATLSINLSRRQFDHGNIVREICELLDRTGFDPARLCLEITETALFADSRRSRTLLSSLNSLGLRLAIDDFGAGYSSLLELRDFPIREVKIDRAFIADVVTNVHSQDIVRAIVSIAGSIGAEVVAEGIESRAQFDTIAALGCDRGQGYWLCEPMTATTLPGVSGASDRMPIGVTSTA